MKQFFLSIFAISIVFSLLPSSALAQDADPLAVIDKTNQDRCVFQKNNDIVIKNITNLLPNTSYRWKFVGSAAWTSPSTWAGAIRHEGFTTKTETSHSLTIPAVDTRGLSEGIYYMCLDNRIAGVDRCTGGSNMLAIKLTNGEPSGDTSCNQVFPTPTPIGAKGPENASCSYDDCNGEDCRKGLDNSVTDTLNKPLEATDRVINPDPNSPTLSVGRIKAKRMCIISSKLGEPLKCGCGPVPPPPSPPCDKSALDPKTGMCTQIKTAIGNIETTPIGFVKVLFGIFLSLAGGIAVILLIVSGYQIMTSEGNPEKIQGARETITSAIIGLVFLIFSLAILQIIGVTILKIPGLGK